MEDHEGMNPQESLTLAEVAEVFAITVDEAAELARAGALEAVQLGEPSEWRVSREALEAFIAERYAERRREARLTGGMVELGEFWG